MGDNDRVDIKFEEFRFSVSDIDEIIKKVGMMGEPVDSAQGILEAAIGEMEDRAKTYDKPQGERSMGATVRAFKAITGVQMSEQQGWQFMEVLKMVRSNQGAYRADSFIDGAAYAALAGEAASRE